MADDDLRDERLGALLEVEPLDDLTRHRLVTSAVRGSRPPRAVRWVAAAAVALLLIAGGAVLFLAPGSHADRQAATPVRTPAEAKGAAGARPSVAADTAGGSTTDLGDLGDLARAANRDRARQAAERGADGGLAAGNAAPTVSTDPLVAELGARGCRASLPAGVISAVGTGTLSGERAIVVVTTAADGTRSLDVAVGDPCVVRPLS
jgi:hypothetical protein